MSDRLSDEHQRRRRGILKCHEGGRAEFERELLRSVIAPDFDAQRFEEMARRLTRSANTQLTVVRSSGKVSSPSHQAER